jgi:phosphohistidine phosphatase
MARRGLSNARLRVLFVKTLHLLRHAKAEASLATDPADHARPLAKRGQKAAEAMAAHLAECGFAVDRVFCSTAARARESLAPLMGVLGSVPVAFRDQLYMIDADELLAFVKALPDTADSVLLVGHNPTYYELALRLIGKAPGQTDAWNNLKEKFNTGALCSISFDVTRWADIKPRGGTLRGFVRPRDLGV